jgi:hypothetical protein
VAGWALSFRKKLIYQQPKPTSNPAFALVNCKSQKANFNQITKPTNKDLTVKV